jgi:hypothetical protein
MKLQELKHKLASGIQNLPYIIRSEELLKIEEIGRQLKEKARESLRYGIPFSHIVNTLFISVHCCL